MEKPTDQEIIESVKKGNQSDYSLLIDRYKNKAFPLLVRMLKNELEAEEVLQDCFLKAYNSLKEFRYEAKFSTWFYKIVYNTALSKLSAKKRKIESGMLSIDDQLHLESKENFRILEQKDISNFVKNLINQLPSKYASVISLFYLENMTCKEISGVMGLSVTNVKVILYRARNAFKDVILKNKFAEELL